MTAVAGFVWHDGRSADDCELTQMMHALAHRGTDGRGTWTGGPAALGHQMRWSTPESQHEDLPLRMCAPDIVLTADARVDNRDDLFAALSVPVPRRAAMPDSMLIGLAYRKWGTNCPVHIIGEFAFAIWDEREQLLFCAVDAMGVRPLYYARPPNRFAFASEARALTVLPGVPRRLNEARFAERLVTGLFWRDKEATFFDGIQLVPPGHSLTVRREGIRLERYWAAEHVPAPGYRRPEDFVDAARDVFTEAVRCRLRSAYPVASLLSGGLDSTAIVAVAARELVCEGRRLTAVSAVLPEDHAGPERDEKIYMAAVAKLPGIDWTCVTPNVDLYDTLEMEFEASEVPSAPRHDVFCGLHGVARDAGARTLFDGRGGELGMTAHGGDYLTRSLTTGHWLRLTREIVAGARVHGVSAPRYAFGAVLRPLWRKHRRAAHDPRIVLAQSPIAAEFARRHRIPERLREEAANGFGRERSAHAQRVATVFRMARPQRMLEGAFGLELAHPFRDRRVVELAIHLPEQLTMWRGYGRGLVRRALDGVLPPEVQWRLGKTAFSPDYYRRLRAARQRIRAELEHAAVHDRVREFLDVPRMIAALDTLSAAEDWAPGRHGLPGDPAALLLDSGVILARYLQWFDARESAAPTPMGPSLIP